MFIEGYSGLSASSSVSELATRISLYLLQQPLFSQLSRNLGMLSGTLEISFGNIDFAQRDMSIGE